MKQGGESPPPAFATLDGILSDFKPSGSAGGLRKPGGKVRVRKKGQFLKGLRKALASKKKGVEPNCARDENVSVSGSAVRTMRIGCEGCAHSSDLADGECRSRCARLLGREPCAHLVLDNGLCKREYGEEDTRKLEELNSIAEGFAVKFPQECGLCAQEHEKQVDGIREVILKDPLSLLERGVEVDENQEMSVRGVERDVCGECRKRAEDAVDRAFQRLRESRIAEGYDFKPLVRPFFANSRILFELPDKSRVEDAYEVGGAKVVLSRGEEEVYSVFPSEYRLGRQQLEAMKLAYSSVIGRGCSSEKQFRGMCKSEIAAAAANLGFDFPEQELEKMASDLVRCTMGLDVIELLLKDPNLQDVYINSPIDSTPLYVKHRDFDDCRTNVYLSERTARNIISKFRLRSGRSFSEVSPILDMDLPEFGVRVNITGPPVSPDGLAFAFRRASEEPWTLLRFIENRMISPLAAGLLAVMVNEESTVLMCGDRGSGKTSMLTALVGAMPIKYRILTMEDTFEIPVPTLAREGGFRMQRMRVRPSTATDSHELGADEAMRSLLRMGDSAIVMGEVRGREARTLYEAMNVGGSGNCVLGTIHGKSPRSLLERVVFSLGVPPQSFKATDLVVIADRIRPGGGSRRLRRVSEIVEVRKDWDEPVAEDVFSRLMGYDRDSDLLRPCDGLRDSQVISRIAGKRGVSPRTVLDDIEARAEAYAHAVGLFKETGDRGLLSMRTMVGMNRRYLELVDESIESGGADYGLALDGIKGWLEDRAQRGMRIRIEDGAVQQIAEEV